MPPEPDAGFAALIEKDRREERRIMFGELLLLAVMAIAVALVIAL